MAKTEFKFNRILDIFINDLIPQTRLAVKKGNKVFGAFIIKKSDLSLLITGTNNEIVNPLYHGEISALFNFFGSKKLNPNDYYFISSHEPCSLCLSAITWSGFDNFYYFFPYADTKSSFNIPHDLSILKEVFHINEGEYKKIINTGKAFQLLRKLKNLKIQLILLLKKKLIKLSFSMRNYPLNIKTQRFLIIFL